MNKASSCPPFHIVPWDDDFMTRMHILTQELTEGRPGKAVIVFPLNRPRRYLIDIYRKEASAPILLPHIVNAGQLIQLCLESWTRSIPSQAGILDQVAVLKECLLDMHSLKKNSGALSSIIAHLNSTDGMARFYPWGVRLAHLLNECAAHMVKAEDLQGIDDIVAPYAAALLGKLSSIQEHYRLLLKKYGMSTPGFSAQHAAELAASSPDLPIKLQGKTIILAGFVRLTRSEDSLFRYLWKHGAHICIHTDPSILSSKGHWSCEDHQNWLSRWKARGELAGTSGGTQPVIHFHAGYDLHSQLHELKKELSTNPHKKESRAVVITHDSLLMPTLHHIPEKNINISLGYPLSRSLLSQLVERILETRLSMDNKGCVHWKSLLHLIQHPYIRMLSLDADDASLSLRPFLFQMENYLRKGSRMVDAAVFTADVLDEVLGNLEEQSPSKALNERTGHFLQETINILVTQWKNLETLADAASCMRELCRLLLEYGSHIWPGFPLDAECLVRLMQGLIPELADNTMAEEILSVESLIAIIRQNISEQRVPFEADPLTGLQILGTLETRLLHFDRIYLLDLTEDALPGSPQHDPLLPDSLRPLIGLPDGSRRDILAAHTFHRLIAGAREVFLYWQEGVQASGLMDGKKIRSRFVEEAIWQVEQKRGELLRSGTAPLFSSSFPMALPPEPSYAPVLRSESIHKKVRELLSHSISPSALDTYISCPARFFYQHVCSLQELAEVMEGDDHLGTGTMLHHVLLRALTPFLGNPLPRHALNENTLKSLFYEELQASPLLSNLPAQSLFMLETAGPARLKSFAEAQPDVLEVLQLEHKVSAVLSTDNYSITLKGKLDRLDRREHGLVILDYKTGKTNLKPHRMFWSDPLIWSAMETWSPGRTDPLPELSQMLPSIQLPSYLYICGHDLKNAHYLKLAPLFDAAYVQLADKGEELPLLGNDMEQEERQFILDERIPSLLRFILRHIAEATEFPRFRSVRCAYCPYKSACR